MIRCNLSVLLAERSLKITKVSKDTGISRTTLTSLSNNQAQGIQFETMDTLCNYLNVKPSDLFRHIQGSIIIQDVDYDPEKGRFVFLFYITSRTVQGICKMNSSLFIKHFNADNHLSRIRITLGFVNDSDGISAYTFDEFAEFFVMPVSFMNDFKENLTGIIAKKLAAYFTLSGEFDIVFDWPDECSNYSNDSF